MRRRRAYLALAVLCAAPRVAILVHERAAITSSFTEKSDIFAQTFVQHGTFGMIPGEPSAYTQPLYGWFLIPVYWLFGRSWESIGLAQLAVAIGVAFLVYEIGRRLLGSRAGLVAAAVATLNPYLAWHDMHVNREIVDQACAAAIVLLTLAVSERRSHRLAGALGVACGLAMLGNTRLVFVPIVCVAYLAWRFGSIRATAVAAALVLGGSAVAVAPWIVRNKVSVGCWAITTDGRALWKANNPQTYPLLSAGRWIDAISPSSVRPPTPNRITPEEAWGYLAKGRPDYAYRLYPDECAQMTFYENRALAYLAHHPGQKLRLAALSEQLFWQPSVFETSSRPEGGTQLDLARRLAEPAYMWTLYVLAAIGLVLAPRPFVVLTILLLAYQSACAALFVGATRYRIAWDFLTAILAGATLSRGWAWASERRARGAAGRVDLT